jgi:predicted enzyme related to lactoylglutathione lyase
MIKEFAGASIWSEDLNNLLPFYRDVLGFRVAMESPEFVVLVLGGDSPDTPMLGLGTHSAVHGQNPDPARHMLRLSSDDLTADWERLKAAGVEFIEEPVAYGNLWVATLKDPEGNLIQLSHYRES